MKNKWKEIWRWMKEHPKQMYRYMLGVLILSFIYFIIEVVWLENKKYTTPIPTVLGGSDKHIKKERELSDSRHIKIEEIVQELDRLQKKEILVKSDSIRIEYLLNQYNKLTNETQNKD